MGFAMSVEETGSPQQLNWKEEIGVRLTAPPLWANMNPPSCPTWTMDA